MGVDSFRRPNESSWHRDPTKTRRGNATAAKRNKQLHGVARTRTGRALACKKITRIKAKVKKRNKTFLCPGLLDLSPCTATVFLRLIHYTRREMSNGANGVEQSCTTHTTWLGAICYYVHVNHVLFSFNYYSDTRESDTRIIAVISLPVCKYIFFSFVYFSVFFFFIGGGTFPVTIRSFMITTGFVHKHRVGKILVRIRLNTTIVRNIMMRYGRKLLNQARCCPSHLQTFKNTTGNS